MYNQLSKELKASLFQRIRSPFFGSYLIGLFIFNYRFVFLMMSSKSLEEKFKIIDSANSIIGATPTFYTTLIFPFLFALFYITIVPLFESYVSMPIWKKNQNRLKEKYAKLEKQEVFLSEEKSKYLKEILEIRREKEKLVEELTNHDIRNKQNLEDEIKRFTNKHNEEINMIKTDYEIKQKDLLEKHDKSLRKDFEKINKSLSENNNELLNQLKQRDDSLEEFNIKIKRLEKTNEKLLVKEQLLNDYDSERKRLFSEKKKLEHEKEKLTIELQAKNIEIDKYKRDQEKILDENLKVYLDRFSEDEIMYLMIIYKNDIPDNILKIDFDNQLAQLLSMPRIKVEHISNVLENGGYLYIANGRVYFTDELKKLLVEMFN